MVGCKGGDGQDGPGAAPAAATPPVLVLNRDDDGRPVQVLTGQRVEVRLPAHSASGYRCWLRATPSSLLDLEQEPARVAGAHAWRFRALAAGQGELLFECGQELGSSERRVFAFHMRVR
ncbi:hypothetical protein BIY45_00100 [Stenotrophomonas sp. BIIR7]|nr:hypothetical protein BIY45_00100 [Stenotrophomonas sp. BIIR7]